MEPSPLPRLAPPVYPSRLVSGPRRGEEVIRPRARARAGGAPAPARPGVPLGAAAAGVVGAGLVAAGLFLAGRASRDVKKVRPRAGLRSPRGAGAGLGAAAAVGAGLLLGYRSWRGASLEGEVALVTGGSRGLGYVLAEKLLREGCRVVICGRDDEALERARARLSRDPGGEIYSLPCDVSDPQAVGAVVRAVVELFGSVDLVVNNASIIQVGPLDALELHDFRKALEINYMGMVHTTLAALPHMKAQGGGRIANITSIGGKVAVPHLLPYDAAKFAAVGFSEGLRTEVARDGIRVTTVVPGLMRTGSPVHAEFRGQPEKEYVWFTLGDLLRLSSMSAERAADRIVLAIRRGEAEVTLSWQAKLLRAAHDLSPGGMSRFLTVLGRFLPLPNGGHAARGWALRGMLPGTAEAALDRAGERTNQAPRGLETHPGDLSPGALTPDTLPVEPAPRA